MDIEVISFRRGSRPGPLKAYADVRLGVIEIKNWAIVEVANGTMRVYPPKISWEDARTHQKLYSPIVNAPRDIKQRVELAVLNAWAKENRNEHKK